MRRLTPTGRGVCRSCQRRRDIYPIRRTGGGTYNRGGRSYRSSICADCAMRLLTGAGVYAGASSSRFGVSELERIVASLGTVEAAEVLDMFRQRRANDVIRREIGRGHTQSSNNVAHRQ
jgi:hypothetical protein